MSVRLERKSAPFRGSEEGYSTRAIVIGGVARIPLQSPLAVQLCFSASISQIVPLLWYTDAT